MLDAEGPGHPLEMTRRRVLFLNVVLFVLTIVSLSSLGFDREYWPFSQYPMFSSVAPGYSLSGLQLYGVAREAPHREIPLRASDYIEPFDQARLSVALDRIGSRRNPERRQKLLDDALLDCLERYEKFRLDGRHDGPPIRGVKLYRAEWRLDAAVGDVNRPDHRELVAEVGQVRDDD